MAGVGHPSPMGARAESAWLRSYPFWDLYFAVVLAATVLGIVVDEGAPATEATATALLLLLAAAYILWGRRAIRPPAAPPPEGRFGRISRYAAPEGRRYAAAMLVLFTAADLMEPVSAIALSALVPMAFMSLRIPQAVVLMLAFFAGPTINLMRVADPLLVLAGLAIGLSGSAVLGVFIDRLSVQNHERARLIGELDRTRGALAAVSREAGMLAERERLAGDIHDTLAQGLSAIVMLLQSADAARDTPVALALRTARENLAETRALIAALTPPALDGATLRQALTRLAGAAPPPATVTVTGTPVPLAPETQVALVRAAQEALANTRKHACADSVRLALTYTPTGARLEIADDGTGFPLSADAGAPTREGDLGEGCADEGGFGLEGMRRRVGRAGGSVRVESAPGRGTTVVVEVPCSE
jgi:signal transduction histidine kinase